MGLLSTLFVFATCIVSALCSNFVVYSDPQEDYTTNGKIANLTLAYNPVAILIAGDGTDKNDHYAALRKAEEFRMNKVFLAFGNHDDARVGRTNFYNEKVINYNVKYRSTSDVSFIVPIDKDTVAFMLDYRTSDLKGQTVWLDEQLSVYNQPNIFVIQHYAYACGNYPFNAHFSDLKAWIKRHTDRVKAVISGHIHTYYKAVIDGTLYFADGTAGGGIRPCGSGCNPPFEKCIADEGFLAINTDKCTISFINIKNVKGDETTYPCTHTGGGDTTLPPTSIESSTGGSDTGGEYDCCACCANQGSSGSSSGGVSSSTGDDGDISTATGSGVAQTCEECSCNDCVCDSKDECTCNGCTCKECDKPNNVNLMNFNFNTINLKSVKVPRSKVIMMQDSETGIESNESISDTIETKSDDTSIVDESNTDKRDMLVILSYIMLIATGLSILATGVLCVCLCCEYSRRKHDLQKTINP
jgi:predicted phosphodiesterase